MKRIKVYQVLGGDWSCWIPPTGPESFDCGDYIGPYGDTYFSTFEEAHRFAESYLEFESVVTV